MGNRMIGFPLEMFSNIIVQGHSQLYPQVCQLLEREITRFYGGSCGGYIIYSHNWIAFLFPSD
jgi:hypothetical protein